MGIASGWAQLATQWTPPSSDPESSTSPWGVVWCCSDLPWPPEELLGAAPGELIVLQGPSTIATPDVTANVSCALSQHEIQHVVVLAHAGCRVLRRALAHASPRGMISEQIARLGLFAGADADEVSRELARDASRTLRRQLARVGVVTEVVPLFVDGEGRIIPIRDDVDAS